MVSSSSAKKSEDTMRRKRMNEYSRKSEMIQEFMQPIATEQGLESGFVKRRSKLTATAFTETLVLGCWIIRRPR
jgi:hypothetical protein